MIKYEMRFWDKKNQHMIFGAGLSPNQLPIIRHEDGRLEELQGEFVPMLCTFQKALNGYIWEGDVVEVDVPVLVMEGMPTSFMKLRGIMQYIQAKGSFTVNIYSDKNEENNGAEFLVSNARIIGSAISNPELLNPNYQTHDTSKIPNATTEKPAN